MDKTVRSFVSAMLKGVQSSLKSIQWGWARHSIVDTVVIPETSSPSVDLERLISSKLPISLHVTKKATVRSFCFKISQAFRRYKYTNR